VGSVAKQLILSLVKQFKNGGKLNLAIKEMSNEYNK